MLFFTYNTKEDGMGSQYQRIIGIMALAKRYDATYVHTQIEQMEHLPNKEYLDRIEQYFQIGKHYPSVKDFKYDLEVLVEMPDESELLYLNECAEGSDDNVLVKISFPQTLIDKNPGWYDAILPQLREIKQQLILSHFKPGRTNVAIHIRRGDVDNIEHPTRFTPIEVYANIIDHFLKAIPNVNICIFSEENEKNRNEFKILKEKNHVQVLVNLDMLNTFEHLVCADLLITSRSSFSYIAALLNPNRIIYMDFWHPPLERWNILA
jgi:hypothetical protein